MATSPSASAAASLTTERLVLRRWRDDDLPRFAALNADADVMEHFPSVLARTESDALAARIDKTLAENGFGFWAVEIPGEADFIGFTGISRVDFGAHFTPAVEIGWRLARAYWGRGLATEAARAALAYGFDAAGLDEIVSFTSIGNVRSQRVMARIGMTHDPADDFDHPFLPSGHRLERHVLYRITRDRWRETGESAARDGRS